MSCITKSANASSAELVQQTQSDLFRLGDILDEITGTLRRYIALTAGVPELLALWIAHTYCFSLFQFTAYLSIRSPIPRCGKTRLLTLIALYACDAPKIQTLPRPAVIYRRGMKPLILDEVDQLGATDKGLYKEVIAVLNAGFKKGAVVERMEPNKKGGWDVKEFSVFSSKAFAGIEKLSEPSLIERT